LVTECVRGAIDHLERHQQSTPEGFEEVTFQDLREHHQVRYTDDLGVVVHGVILQLHPPWSPDKTHIVICKTNASWVPEPSTKKMYVCRESIHGLLKKKAAEGPTTSNTTPTPTPTPPTTTPTSTATNGVASFNFENVQWRDLRAGDKIRVTYVNIKNPSVSHTAYGIFRAAPTYSDVVEFVKTDETFNNLSKSFTSLPLTGSMCRFQRLTHKTNTHFPNFPQAPSTPAWASGSCATMPNATANASTKKRKVA
jgi:hypothetical protein